MTDDKLTSFISDLDNHFDGYRGCIVPLESLSLEIDPERDPMETDKKSLIIYQNRLNEFNTLFDIIQTSLNQLYFADKKICNTISNVIRERCNKQDKHIKGLIADYLYRPHGHLYQYRQYVLPFLEDERVEISKILRLLDKIPTNIPAAIPAINNNEDTSHPFIDQQVYELFKYLNEKYHNSNKVRWTYLFYELRKRDTTLAQSEFFRFIKGKYQSDLSDRLQPNANSSREETKLQRLTKEFDRIRGGEVQG